MQEKAIWPAVVLRKYGKWMNEVSQPWELCDMIFFAAMLLTGSVMFVKSITITGLESLS